MIFKNITKFIFIIIFLFFIFVSKADAVVTGAVIGGFSIPEGIVEGVLVRQATVNIGNPPDNIYVLLNNDSFVPGFMDVGDILKITNLQTGKSFTYDSECSTKKMPPLNLNGLLSHEAYQQYGRQDIDFKFINKCPNGKNIELILYLYLNSFEIVPFLQTMISVDSTLPPTSTPTPTSTQTPTPTPTPAVLSDFKQTDPEWSTAPNLPVNVNTRLNHSLNCGDMYGFGCAVTSVADVFYSYGKTMLANASLNPGSLNNWLTNNKGFQFCSIIWPNMSATIGLGAPTVMFRNNNANWTAGQQAIDSALAIGNLPIIGVYTNPEKTKTHFFVISEKLPDVTGKPDYKIIDPALYPFVTNNLGKTGQALSLAYGGWDKVFETVIYRNNSTPQKTLTIRGHSPIQMEIIDPLGNTTGFDEATQEIVENIPNSTYGVEPGIAPVDGSSPAADETKYFQQIDPLDGEYTVKLIGTGNGSYSLDFSKTDKLGNVSTQVTAGIAQTGVNQIYTLTYTPNATEQPVINKIVTFDVLENDIRGLYKQKEIKNKGVFKSLLAQSEFIEKMAGIKKQPLGTNLAIIVLKTLQFELTRFKNKGVITDNAYEIVNNDLKILIKQLQNNLNNPGGSSGGNS